MRKLKIHYVKKMPKGDGLISSPCGFAFFANSYRKNCTDIPTKVTCKNCKNHLAKTGVKKTSKLPDLLKSPDTSSYLTSEYSPVLDTGARAKANKRLNDLLEDASGNLPSLQCLRICLYIEFPLDSVLDAEGAFDEALSYLQEYGTTAITETKIVDKEW